MNAVAILCMIAAGVTLPMMNVVFGNFVTIFNDFMMGKMSAADFRSEVDYYAYIILPQRRFRLQYY